MAYIGNIPAESYSAFQKQDFTTSATTSYTLDHPVANQNELALFINFVRQEPTAAYTASGTSLTLTSATSVGDDMYCVYLGKAVQTVVPPSGSVGAAQLNYPLTTFSSTGIDDNATSTAITIDSSENVGIGTGTPSGQLHVVGSDTTNQVKIENTDGGTASAPDLVLFRNSSSPANNDALGRIHFRGKTDSGAENNYAYMYATSGTVANGSEDGNLFIGGLINGADRGWLTLKEYEIAVNDDSDDIDFRVESNAQTHMLFVNAGNSRIGLQDSSPAYMLESGNSDTGKGWSLANENNVYKIRTRATANDTQTHIQFENTNGVVGSIKTNGTATQFNTSSDYRLKENISYDFDATARLKQLKPARFNFIGDTDKTVDGFIAHEVSSIVPEAITGTKDAMETLENVVLNADGSLYKCNFTEAEWIKGKADGIFAADSTWSATFTRPEYQGIDQAKLVPLLVKTIQELEARITELENA